MSRRGAVSLIVLVVILAACLAAIAKLGLDRSVLAQAFGRYAALAPGPSPEESPEAQRIATALQGARESVVGGNYRAALRTLEAVGVKAPPRPSPTGEAPRAGRPQPSRPPFPGLGGPQGAARSPLNITPKAMEFLRQHKELDRKAFQVTRLGGLRKEQGRDVTEGRKLFVQAMTAAEQGDAEAADHYLDQAAQALGGFPKQMPRGQQGAPGPSPFEEIMDRLTKATNEAAARGGNVKHLRQLMQQLREAGKQRDEKRAKQLILSAAQELRQYEAGGPGRAGARRFQGRRGPQRPGREGMMARGPQAGPAYLLYAALMTMRGEQGLLGSIGEHLFNAKRSLREDNQEQVSEIIGEAQTDLQGISRGRAHLVALTTRPAEGRGPGRPPGRLGEALLPGLEGLEFLPYRPDEAQQKITALLDEVHSMSDIEYAAARDELWQELLKAMRAQPRPPKLAPEGQPPTEERAVSEEQVRAKLLLAEEPFKQKQQHGEDVREIAEKLSQARQLLYEEEYERAISIVNEALGMLGVPVEAIKGRGETLPRPENVATPNKESEHE